MNDAFINLVRSKTNKVSIQKRSHESRAHSKFSASGASRWFNCPGSVELSEGIPDKPSKWSHEGTRAHEVLEALMRQDLNGNDETSLEEFEKLLETLKTEFDSKSIAAMIALGTEARDFILNRARKRDAEVLLETRVYLDFIDNQMFGTFDSAIIDHWGTLDVFDYKYGSGIAVSAKDNLQMIFYGLGLAHQYDWNFKKVRLWIIQPRIKGYDGPTFWELPTTELKGYIKFFREAVKRVRKNPEFREGGWCHWCRAKQVCPLKKDKKIREAQTLFGVSKEKNEKSENEGNRKWL